MRQASGRTATFTAPGATAWRGVIDSGPELASAVSPRHAREQHGLAHEAGDKFALRGFVHLARRAALRNQAVCVHHDDLVAHGQCLALVVRDIGHGEVAGAAAGCGFLRASRGAGARRGCSTARRTAAPRAPAPGRAPAPRAAAGRRRARWAGGRRSRPGPRCAGPPLPRTRASFAPPRHAQPVHHVLEHVHVREQRVALEHHADVALSPAPAWSRPCRPSGSGPGGRFPAPQSCAAWWSCRSPRGRGWW
jgi:hypothetical protein